MMVNNGLNKDELFRKLIKLLCSNVWLAELSDEQIAQLAHQAQFEQRQVGDILVEKGDPGRRFYFILEGQIRVIDHLDGQIWVEGYLFEGEFSGEFALLRDGPQPFTEDIAVDAVLAVFDQTAFNWLIQIAPQVSQKLMERESLLKAQAIAVFEGQRYSEAIVLQFKRHFVAFLSKLPGPILLITLGTAIGIFLFNSSGGPVSAFLSGCFVLLGLLAVTYLYLDWRNDDFLVTTERAIHIERILLHGETREEAPLTSIQDVSVTVPNLFAKLFDYSDLHIQTAGAGTIIFDGIKSADRMRDEMFRQRLKAQERVEASDARTLRDSLKQIMGSETVDKVSNHEPGQKTIAQQPRFKVPRVINHYIPRVQEVEGEIIIWRKNYFVFFKLVLGPLLVAMVWLYLMLAALFGFFPFREINSTWLWITLIGWPFLLLWYSYQYDIWRKDEYLVTNSSIIDYKGSAFNLKGEQRRVGTFDVIQNSTYVTPNFMAKLLNIGHVVIETAGTEMTFTFGWVYNPSAVQQEIFKRWLAYKESKIQQDRAYEEQRLIRWLGEYHNLLISEETGTNPQQVEATKA